MTDLELVGLVEEPVERQVVRVRRHGAADQLNNKDKLSINSAKVPKGLAQT